MSGGMVRWLLIFATGCGGLAGYNPAWMETDQGSPGWYDTDSDIDSDTDTDTDTDTDSDTEPLPYPNLYLSEVVDHEDISFIKFIEIYNADDRSVNLGSWAIRRYSNGATTPDVLTLPGDAIKPGGAYVLASSGSGVDTFLQQYGRSANLHSGKISGNGNDVYELVFTGTVVDVYGEPGVDGLGQPWEYTDAVARRVTSVTRGRSAWQEKEWVIYDGAEEATPFSR